MRSIRIVIFILRNVWEKQLIHLAGLLKFRMPQNSPFLAKTCAADRANNIQSLMLPLGFMVNSRLKNTQWHFYEINGMS